MAPTPGDIGGCAQPPDLLDAPLFFEAKGELDCQACRRCDFDSRPCDDACAGDLEETQFPDGCFPLVHDGEVCLRALDASDCDEYERYVADRDRTVPTECNFCPDLDER